MNKLKKLKKVIIVTSIALLIVIGVNVGISYFKTHAALDAAGVAVHDAANVYRAAHDAFSAAYATVDHDDTDSLNAALVVGDASVVAYEAYESAYHAYQVKYNEMY